MSLVSDLRETEPLVQDEISFAQFTRQWLWKLGLVLLELV